MKEQKRLIVDMDGVLADVYQQFLSMEEKEFGKRQLLKDITGRPEDEVFKHAKEYVNSKGFFRHAPVIEDSIDALKKLNDKYELFIVSAATEFPNSLTEKYAWLGEHFPFITWQQIVFCGSKTIVQGDIMIDDYYKNLDSFKGQTILFTQPHNDGHDDNGHTRVYSWKDVAKILL